MFESLLPKVVEESTVYVNESVTETKAEYIKYALTNPKYELYVRDGEYLGRYTMRNMYIAAERFIIMGRTLHIIIRIWGIDPCFMMNKNRK